MNNVFATKEAKVLVVDHNSANRISWVKELNEIGFSQVEGLSNLEDGLERIEKELPDWILCSCFENENVSVFNLLALLQSEPELNQVILTVILDSSLQGVKEFCFQQGCISVVEPPKKASGCRSYLDNFLSLFESVNYQPVAAAASVLGNSLIKADEWSAVLDFYQKLLKISPSNLEYLQKIALAQGHLEKEGDQKRSLWMLNLLSEDEEQFEKLSKGMPEVDFAEEKQMFAQAFGVKKALILLQDSGIGAGISKKLDEIGVESVFSTDSDQAWKNFEEDSFEVVILDWSLNGITFSQRVIHKASSTLLMTLAEKIEFSDHVLLTELGVTQVFDKQLSVDEWVAHFVDLVKSKFIVQEARDLAIQTKKAILDEDKEESQRLFRNLAIMEGVSESLIVEIEAGLLYLDGFFEKSKQLAMKAIINQQDSIYLLMLLGKCYLKLNQPEAALLCMEQAKEFSPENIQRLCQIAETHSEEGDYDKAHESLDEAIAVDPDSELVQEATAKVSVHSGETAVVKELLQDQARLKKIFAYMNNKGVSYAQLDKQEACIEFYQKAIDSIPDSQKSYRGVVYYNLGLAYVRQDQLDKANAALAKASELGDEKIVKKSKDLAKRVAMAQKKGLKLKTKTKTSNSLDFEKERRLLNQVGLVAGNLGCYKIYDGTSKVDPQLWIQYEKPISLNKNQMLDWSKLK